MTGTSALLCFFCIFGSFARICFAEEYFKTDMSAAFVLPSNTCPAGYSMITSESECEAAALVLNLDDQTVSSAYNHVSGYHLGCQYVTAAEWDDTNQVDITVFRLRLFTDHCIEQIETNPTPATWCIGGPIGVIPSSRICGAHPKCATLPCTDGTHSSILGEPLCAAAVCVQDEAACCAENVDCVGAWSTCAVDCGDKTFTVSTAASGSGQECSESDAATAICNIGDGNCVETVDCVGAWSTCAVDCGDKTFTISTAASGSGQECSEADAATAICNIGDGDCVENVDCVGVWSTCAADCGDKTFTISTAASGSGQECSEADAATAICNIGDGNCSGDCIGAWSTCAADCGDKTFTISTAVSGSGQECSEADAATAICNIGDDDCSGAATSVCSFSAMLVAMLVYSIM